MTKEEGLKLIKGFNEQIIIYDEVLDFLEFLQSHRESIESGIMCTIDIKKDTWRAKRNNLAMYCNGIQAALEISKEEIHG